MDAPSNFVMKKYIYAVAIVCMGALTASGIYFFGDEQTAEGQVVLPFEGKIVNIEYNCLCSGAIMLTVQPTPATQQQGAQQMDLLLVWAAQALQSIADNFGVDAVLPLIIPTTFLWCQVYDVGNQQLLGNYVPGGFPCYEFVGPPDWCRFKMNAQGAILYVGTSAF